MKAASTITRCITLCALALASLGALAQAYPAKPVRLIIPFPPGGGFDALGRPFAERLGSSLGQPVVIENRAGASGNIGAAAATRAAADGYTLLLGNDFLALNVVLSANPGYDALNDLAPISLVGTVPNVLAVSPSLGVKDLAQLASVSKTRVLNFGSPAPGSVGHLLGELMNQEGVLRLMHVPYKGSAPAVTDVIGGTLDAVITTLPSVAAQIRGGKLAGIGIFSARRAASMPELPTIAESGGTKSTGDVWYGLFTRAGTPEAVVSRVNDASVQVLRQPELIDVLRKAGFEPGSSTPAALAAQLRNDVEKWGRVAKAANLNKE